MKPVELFSAAINEIQNRLPFSAISRFKKQMIEGQSGKYLLSACLSRYNCRIIPIASVIMIILTFVTGILEGGLNNGLADGIFSGGAAEVAGEVLILVTAVFGVGFGFYFSGRYPAYYPYVFWGMYLLSYFIKVTGCAQGASGLSQTAAAIAVISIVPIFNLPAAIIYQLSIPIYYAIVCNINNVVTYYPYTAFCLAGAGILASATIYTLFCTRMIDSRKLRDNHRRIELSGKLDRQTGVYTREYGLDKAQQLLSAGQAAVILVDIDDFGKYNRVTGPTRADKTLRDICNCIKIVAKPYTDIVSRFEGDKLMICMPAENDKEAIMLSEEIRSSVRLMDISFPESRYMTVTVTTGMARNENGESFDQVFQKAAASLNTGKKAGGNCIAYKGHIFRADEQ